MKKKKKKENQFQFDQQEYLFDIIEQYQYQINNNQFHHIVYY
jgi:hypothetical protein